MRVPQNSLTGANYHRDDDRTRSKMGARPFSKSIRDPGEVAGLPGPTSTEPMAYQVTARKWRPRKFEEVVGQDHITATLANALESGRVAHCYQLC